MRDSAIPYTHAPTSLLICTVAPLPSKMGFDETVKLLEQEMAAMTDGSGSPTAIFSWLEELQAYL